MKPTLLVLAAGIGSRFGGLKQVAGVGPSGEAIMEYAVYDAIRAGFGKVVFIIRHAIEKEFKARFEHKFEALIQVEYVFQELDSPISGIADWPSREKPWGTGHAVLMAQNVTHEPFAVINADDYYGAEAFRVMASFLSRDCHTHHLGMVGYLLNNTLSENGAVSRGVCEVDEHGMLQKVAERHQIQRADEGISCFDDYGNKIALSENALVSMNLWGFPADIFPEIERQFVSFFNANRENPRAEFYIPTVVNNLLATGNTEVSVLPNSEQWYGVTYQEDKPVVEAAFREFVRQGKYPEDLWAT